MYTFAGVKKQVVVAAAVPSVLLVLVLIVVAMIILLAYIKRRKVHRLANIGNEYDSVDYKPHAPTLPPRQFPNVAYHIKTDSNEYEKVCFESQSVRVITSSQISDDYEN